MGRFYTRHEAGFLFSLFSQGYPKDFSSSVSGTECDSGLFGFDKIVYCNLVVCVADGRVGRGAATRVGEPCTFILSILGVWSTQVGSCG